MRDIRWRQAYIRRFFLFAIALILILFGSLNYWATPAKAAPNPDIAILNSFVPNAADPGFPSTYRLTLRNITGSSVSITGLTHQLPSTPGSLVFDATAPTFDDCGSDFTITNTGSNPGTPAAFQITSGTIPAGDPGQCTIEIPVKGFEAGNHNDTIAAGALFTNVGENEDPTSATLEIETANDVTINKSFSPNTIPGNGRSTVTIKINNPNDFDLTGTTTTPTLVDELPSTPHQMVVDTRTGADVPATTCGGTISIQSGDTGIQLSGGTIPANSSCTITFPVTQSNGGEYTNTIPTASLSTENQVSNGSAVTADLNIQTEVSIAKNMAAGTLDEGEETILTITITNGSAALTNAGLTDDLPAPIVAITSSDNETNCTASGNFESFSVTNNASSISLVNGVIPSSDPDTNDLGECEIRVRVKHDPSSQTSIDGNSDTLTNTIPASALTNDQGQTNTDPATDTVRVRPALRAEKSYSNDNQVSPGETTQMTIRVQNRSNTTDATNVSFTDNLPSPLEVAEPLNVSYSSGCGGGTLNSVAVGDTTLVFSGGTIVAENSSATDNCYIRIDVTVPSGTSTPLNLDNVIDNDSIGNGEGFDSIGVTGSGGRLQVVENVVLTKAFNQNVIRRGTESQLVIRIENNRRNDTSGSTLPLTGVTITDDLPDNLQVADPPEFTHTGCSYSSTPNFTGTTAGARTFTMTNASLSPVDDGDASADTCEIKFNVEEIDRDFTSTGNQTPRTYDNQTSNFTNDQNENTGATANAQLTVISPLNGEKSFQSEKIVANGRSTAVVQLNNSMPTEDLTVNSFTDDWTQTNTVIATPSNITTTCGGTGTLTATPGTRSVTLTSGTLTIPSADTSGVFGLCEIRFDVVMSADTPDTFTNEIDPGQIGTTEGFENASTISATLTRTTSSINVNKQFSPNELIVGDPSTLTIRLTNPDDGIPLTEVAFTDAMPTNMVVFSNGGTSTCGGNVSALQGEDSFSFSDGVLAADQTCEITVQVTLIETGNKTNELPISTIESKENVTNSALAFNTLNALTALKPEKSFSPTNVDGGVPSRLTLTITNLQQDNALGESLQNVTITDNLPTDLFVANTPNASTDCPSGTVNVTAGGTVVSMSGATLAPKASCVVEVDVVSPKKGTYDNIIERGDLTGQIQPSLGTTTISNTTKPEATLEVDSDSLPPELVLIKRITAVNGVDITGFDDGTGTEDNDAHWPSPTSDSLRGVIDYTTPVTAGDELEYTIYYLNTGLGNANNVRICDRIPAYTSFFPTGYNNGPAQDPDGFPGADRGIVLAQGSSEAALTNANDGDGGIYFGPGESPATAFPTISCNGDDSNGSVVVSVPNIVPPATAAGTPATSYGYIRFKAVVN